jgi:hypothetical protein
LDGEHADERTISASLIEEVVEYYAQLMQRLLELQSSERSPELIAEDERLMDRLQCRAEAGKPEQTAKVSRPGQARFTA